MEEEKSVDKKEVRKGSRGRSKRRDLIREVLIHKSHQERRGTRLAQLPCGVTNEGEMDLLDGETLQVLELKLLYL